MSATLHLSFSTDGQANAVSANLAIACAGVYPRRFDLQHKDGPQDLDVSIDVDLSAGLLMFAGCRMLVTIAGVEPFEVGPNRPFFWLRESIFPCPIPADVKTIRVEVLDQGTGGVLEVRVPELARRVKKSPPVSSPVAMPLQPAATVFLSSIATPMEAYSAAIKELDELLRAGKITQAEYDTANEKAKDQLKGTK